MGEKLPSNIPMELALIGAMTLNNGEVIPQVAGVVTGDDFVRPEHRIIFEHLVNLWKTKQPVNLIELRNALVQSGSLAKVGAPLLLSLGNLEYTPTYVWNYVRRVKEKTVYRRLMDICMATFRKATEEKMSAGELFEELERRLSDVRVRDMYDTIEGLTTTEGFFKKIFNAEVEDLKAYAQRSCGFSNLDAAQIFTPGLYVLGGLPALGKTTFAWQLLSQFAAAGEKCVYCSYEMARLELFTKLVAMGIFKLDRNTVLSSAEIIKGARSPLMNKVVQELQQTDIDLSVLELRDEKVGDLLRQLNQICVRSKKPPVVCIDYLQIIPHSNESVKGGIDEIVHELKNFQRETNTTFIVISSFNRANYVQSVNFESFKESGGIEYGADVVWGLQLECMQELPKDSAKARETIERAKRELPRRVQLRCLKNRKGSNYDCYFNYHASHDYFEAVDKAEFESVAMTEDNIPLEAEVDDFDNR